MKKPPKDDQPGENPFFRHVPFGWEKTRVRREGEGIDGDEINAVLERLWNALSQDAEENEMRDFDIDLAFERVAALMLSALAMRAANGRDMAARFLFAALCDTLRDYTELLRRDNPALLEIIERSSQVPGWLSTHKPLMGAELKFLEEKKQGSRFPFPRSEKTKTRKKPSILTAQHLLAHEIHTYATEMKRGWMPHRVNVHLSDENKFGRINPLVKKIMAVPDLSLTTVTDWVSLAREILLDATKGEMQGHVVLNRSPYEGMNTGDGSKFFDRLREGFEAKARALEELQ